MVGIATTDDDCDRRGRLSNKFARALRLSLLASALAAPGVLFAQPNDFEVKVLGSVDETIAYWKARAFWGEETREETLLAPRVVVVASNQSWKREADQTTVAVKKELFYRSAAPLILYANELILKDRDSLESIAARHATGQSIPENEIRWLRALATRYRLLSAGKDSTADATVLATMSDLLLRVDIIPASLALGQAAYESGYGTSRFALTGNAFFGQWTWGGRGIKPKEQRAGKGDYRVASYDWPFNSVRGYMLNLNTQSAYSELRRVRAEFRRRGERLSGPALAATLTRYSERGQAYVETLKGMIRVNNLEIADEARLRDEPTVLLVLAEDPEDKVDAEREIEELRSSGQLQSIIESMRLAGRVPDP